MREEIIACLGVFVVMALSNAIVPVLPLLAAGTTAQGAIYSAYFLGAFLMVIPSGILSDRIGEVPLIKTGLFLTFLSAVLFLVFSNPVYIITIRLIEGFGAGIFVASALSLINSSPDHERMSGFFMALLNVGLVAGLIGAGWAAGISGIPSSGIIIFGAMSVLSLIAGLFMRKKPLVAVNIMPAEGIRGVFGRLFRILGNYFWLWVSAVVIIGITGAVTAIYPEFSGLSPHIIGIQIAAMNIATAVSVILVSHAHLPPIITIRVAAILMAIAVMVTFITPWAFIAVGAVAGVVMIAQLAYLAQSEVRQGALMGLFNAASYGGMTLLPFIAGYVAENVTFLAAFALTSLFALCVAATIGRCGCSEPVKNE
jgi:Arabinose efflux permease